MDARFPLATSTWDEKEYESLQRVISSGMFSMGAEVSTFEKQFADYFGYKTVLLSLID